MQPYTLALAQRFLEVSSLHCMPLPGRSQLLRLSISTMNTMQAEVDAGGYPTGTRARWRARRGALDANQNSCHCRREGVHDEKRYATHQLDRQAIGSGLARRNRFRLLRQLVVQVVQGCSRA